MAGIEERRADPAQASTGPMLVMLGAVVAFVTALPAADVLARKMAGQSGASLRWPPNPLATAWGVIVGDPSMGYTASGFLAGTSGPVAARVLPVDPTLVRVVAVALEAVVVVALVLVWRRFGHLLGSGAGHTGFATPRQARDVLGVATLSRRCREIRPDLAGPGRRGLLRRGGVR